MENDMCCKQDQEGHHWERRTHKEEGRECCPASKCSCGANCAKHTENYGNADKIGHDETCPYIPYEDVESQCERDGHCYEVVTRCKHCGDEDTHTCPLIPQPVPFTNPMLPLIPWTSPWWVSTETATSPGSTSG